MCMRITLNVGRQRLWAPVVHVVLRLEAGWGHKRRAAAGRTCGFESGGRTTAQELTAGKQGRGVQGRAVNGGSDDKRSMAGRRKLPPRYYFLLAWSLDCPWSQYLTNLPMVTGCTNPVFLCIQVTTWSIIIWLNFFTVSTTLQSQDAWPCWITDYRQRTRGWTTYIE
jgi:hypothetical protein